jgi:hypothetical protein
MKLNEEDEDDEEEADIAGLLARHRDQVRNPCFQSQRLVTLAREIFKIKFECILQRTKNLNLSK